MRINAYVMAADPAWVEESIGSYYDLVDRIVVSYDRTGTSWTGTPIAVEESLMRLKGVDRLGKMVLAPGDYYRPGENALASDTHQRAAALAQAGEGADWVVQLDTDEVVNDLAELRSCLLEADRRGFTGLEYPARLLVQHVRDDWYLEHTRRFWGVAGAYPGPVAVRANAELRLARQADVNLFRVDFKAHNTDPAHLRDAPVHRIVEKEQAIMHYSWVRSQEFMEAKSRSSGHANDFDWGPRLAWWRESRTSPVRAMLATPVRRGARIRMVRLARIPGAPGLAARRRNGLPG